MEREFPFDSEKARAAILYLASRPTIQITSLDKYKICKLLFLAEKLHLVRYGKPFIGDEFVALDWGPVPQHILDVLHGLIDGKPILGQLSDELTALRDALSTDVRIDRSFTHPRISAISDPDMDVLSPAEVEAMDEVIQLHGRKTFDELKILTHEMPAYFRAWSRRGERERARMSLEEFFEEDHDAREGALEQMHENLLLQRISRHRRLF